MGFFSDLKEDLSQAVNELMPEEDLKALVQETEAATEETIKEEAAKEADLKEEVATDTVAESTQQADASMDGIPDLEKMLENLDAAQWSEAAKAADEEASPVENAVTENAEEGNTAEDTAEASVVPEQTVETEASENDAEDTQSASTESDYDLESMLASAFAAEAAYAEEKAEASKGAERKMDSYASKTVSDETSVITAGMTIAGDIVSEGSVDLIGSINGNIDIMGKLNITGHITGNSKAAEIYAEGAKINGEVVSEGAVKIGASSVVIGNIIATSAAIAGAVKGDIDVKGPVVLDSSAIVMGNIKSKSVQINNGAVIEGMCSQCYAEVSPTTFFDDYKPEMKKVK